MCVCVDSPANIHEHTPGRFHALRLFDPSLDLQVLEKTSLRRASTVPSCAAAADSTPGLEFTLALEAHGGASHSVCGCSHRALTLFDVLRLADGKAS